MANNKKNGKRVERQAAKLLEKMTGEEWHRVPQSGATATQHNTESHVFNGDVFNEASYNDICIEVKKTKDMKACHVFDPLKKHKDWIRQARDESEELFYLLVKVNHQGWFIITSNKVLKKSGGRRVLSHRIEREDSKTSFQVDSESYTLVWLGCF